MRILFCTLPQSTHFLTMAPLAWAARTAGHEVRVASPPGFTKTVTQAGLTAVPVGWDVDPDLDPPEAREAIRRGLPPPYDVAERSSAEMTWDDDVAESYHAMVTYAFRQENEPLLADLVAFSRWWQPDLVIWEPFTFAGPIAAHACGAAHARLMFTMDVLGVAHEWVSGHRARHGEPNQDPLVEWLTEAARAHGLPYTPDLVSGQFTIDQLPGSLRIAAALPYVQMRYVPYGGPAVAPGWLSPSPERPRIALTMGLSATEYFNGYTFRPSEILDALADLEIEVVATIASGEQERLGPVPGNVRVAGYVPLHVLAPTCAAAIHHGGFGTLLTLAQYAVPQLALPYHFEGPLLSTKLAEQGAGLALHSDDVTGPRVRAQLLRLLHEPTFREGATRLRDEIDALPTANQIVAQIEELAASHRARCARATSARPADALPR